MTSLTQQRPITSARSNAGSTAQDPVLTLKSTDDGWLLVSRDGQVVFRAASRGRRECLEYARDHGVLALTT